jgi:hypothetical protein
MYPEGIYKAKATNWGWTETSGGNLQFGMGLQTIGKMDPNNLAAAPKPCEPGTGRWSITPTTEKSEDWLISTVQSLGYDRDDLHGLDPDQENAFNFEGVEFLVQCKHKEYNGQMREEWFVYNPRPKAPASKLDALEKRFGHKFKEAKERQTTKKAPETKPAGSPNNDDTPF